MAFISNDPMRAFTIQNHTTDPLHVTAKDRYRWALQTLISDGSKCYTLIRNPVLHLPAHAHDLRKAGIGIETITEALAGPSAGTGAMKGKHCVTALRIVILCQHYVPAADRAAMLAAFVWGTPRG